MYSFNEIEKTDPQIAQIIRKEFDRQSEHIELIASENWVSNAVMAAQGSILTNKYAEGYPQKRYYGGCEVVDEAEQLAIDRAKALFNCEYANVQPHSGAQANIAVEMAVLEPGDTLMGMALDQGGHLTHGSPVNFSGRYFNIVPYGVNEDGYIDYDALEELVEEHKPKMIISGASAYPRIIDFERIGEIAHAHGAIHWADIAHIAGLVVAGVHPSPFPHADIVTTTTHKTLRGPRGGVILSSAEINERFNFNKAIFPGSQGGPLMHVIAAKAIAFKEAGSPAYREYIANVVNNCKALAKGLIENGISLVSGGTDNHLLLVDLSPLGLTGKEMEKWLDKADITSNKNTVPNDPQSPFVTSGLRLGTAAATSRGLEEADFIDIARAISLVVKEKEAGIEKAKAIVSDIAKKHPLTGGF